MFAPVSHESDIKGGSSQNDGGDAAITPATPGAPVTPATPGPRAVPVADRYRVTVPREPGRVEFRRSSSHGDPTARPRRRARARRRRIRRRSLAAGLVLLGVALLAVGWVAIRGWQAKGHLEASAGLVVQLQRQVEAGDTARAGRTLPLLQEETAAARRTTHDPVWRAGRHLPWVGDDLAAATTVAGAMDDLADDGLPAVLGVVDTLDPSALAPRSGRVDLAPVRAAAPRLVAADASVREARDAVAAIDTGGLFPQVRAPVVRLRDELIRVSRTTGTAARAGSLVPPLLGADGPRTYLVVFQNLAEVRATGGLFGAYAVIRADGGTVRLVEQGTAAADLRVFEKPVLPLDAAQRALYTDRIGTYPGDVNFSPHFPTAAVLAREMYHRRTGRTVDGVVATDPVALSYLLAGTGPVRLPDGGTLTAGNAVRVLLSDAYAGDRDDAATDRFFAGAARATFDALAQGRGDPRRALTGLVRAAGERRLLVWSARPGEQAQLAGTVLGGTLRERDGARPAVGVFLNDGTGAKLGYYLRRSVVLTPGPCRADGRREMRLRVTLTSTAPRSGLSPSVLGLSLGVPRYTVRTNVLVFSPTGGGVLDVRRAGRAVPVGGGSERGRTVGVVTVDLAPGATQVLDVRVVSGLLPDAGRTQVRPVVRTSPGVTATPVRIDRFPQCSG